MLRWGRTVVWDCSCTKKTCYLDSSLLPHLLRHGYCWVWASGSVSFLLCAGVRLKSALASAAADVVSPCSPIPAVAMPRKSDAAWRWLRIATRTCVEGGYLKQPHVLAAESFRADDGRDIQCVAVGKSEGWLAEAVTGKHVNARSLSRNGVFEEMRQKFTQKGQVTCIHGSGWGGVGGGESAKK